ncbi:hypothetical protein Rsub_01929 [Raphidocelis subcapitata]|uniref:Protein kinase domain-containing protein n=1 Tax=Raphidocelis subcapitata TaxID=307507 RepID=A0A2V0NRE2_9CHLO|nr:hypothetical protein Rsub_01929 [Raphidocelis subcapitata]|eukprot:GBF89212.1 hypothetical protein Rsub_01929 [Raphidocelis subcapitata]
MGVGSSIPVQRRTRVEACRALPRGASDTCAPLAPVDAPRSSAASPRNAAAVGMSDSRLSLSPSPHAATLKPSWILSSAADAKHARRRGAADTAAVAAAPARPRPDPAAAAPPSLSAVLPALRAGSDDCHPPLDEPAAAPAAAQGGAPSTPSAPGSDSSGSSTAVDAFVILATSAASAAGGGGAAACGPAQLPDLMEAAWFGQRPAPATPRAGGSSDAGAAEPKPAAREPAASADGKPPPRPHSVVPPFAVPSGTEISARMAASPALFRALAERGGELFESGALLGAGGDGEVRLVRVDGADYALKLSGPPGEVFLAPLISSPWVQMPLAAAPAPALPAQRGGGGGDRWLCAYPLAEGDLEQVAQGLRARGHGMSFDQLRAVAAEMLVALRRVHAAGVRHGDVKPSNWLVMASNHVVLSDFGNSGPAAADPKWSGTPGFAAPEQACSAARRGPPPEWRLRLRAAAVAVEARLRGRATDFRPVDIWGLGATLFHLLCPWPSEAAAVLAAAARRPVDWTPPTWLPNDLFDLLFNCMLVPNPRARLSVRGLAAHPFFAGVRWRAVEVQRVPPPLDLPWLAQKGRGAQLCRRP